MHPASAGSEHARVGPALEALSLGEVLGSRNETARATKRTRGRYGVRVSGAA
jgi:hypothetical protein